MIAAEPQVTLNGAAPTYQVGASAGNSEAAGYQPAAPIEQSASTSSSK